MLRKVSDFIQATEICTESTNAPKKAKAPVDRNADRGDRRPRLEVIDPRFTMDPMSIVMEVKEYLMLKRPQLMTLEPKPHNAQKYYEFYEQSGHTNVECRELRKALHELANKG